jgi:hypothetical protein
MRRWSIALQWTIATAAALAVTNFLLELLFFGVLGYAAIFLYPLFAGAAFGSVVGLFQWLVLRRHRRDSAGWIVATTVGFAAAWVTALIIIAGASALGVELQPFPLFLAFAISTPLIGIAQSRALRRMQSPASSWIAVSTLAWTACVAVMTLLPAQWSAIDALAALAIRKITGVASISRLGEMLLGGVVAGAISAVRRLPVYWKSGSP